MKQIKILAIALILCCAGFVSLSAFKADSKVKIYTSGEYIYNSYSDEEEDFRNINNWIPVDSQNPVPECPDTEQIPCYVIYSGPNFANYLSTATMNDLLNLPGGTKSVQ